MKVDNRSFRKGDLVTVEDKDWMYGVVKLTACSIRKGFKSKEMIWDLKSCYGNKTILVEERPKTKKEILALMRNEIHNE